MTDPTGSREPIETLTEAVNPGDYSTPKFHPLVPSADGVIRILPYSEGDDEQRE
ncbi:hypothetical protein [Nocardia ignorata]|uniref:Uncharacterized protein n=1 Tax=Nocardia ignorata TaxID=145285 RepID=A0A4R6P093_NOCIG|nr:hypothetical protein [Nocardia ignorata]TDP29805.1 hypothetical protein DFR75_11273 [Nocardia ignorata]